MPNKSDSSQQLNKNTVKLSVEELLRNECIEEVVRSDPRIYNSEHQGNLILSVNRFSDKVLDGRNMFPNPSKKDVTINIPIMFRRDNERPQHVYISVDDNPPPPYDDSIVYVYRDGRYMAVNRPARDTSRTPPTYPGTQMESIGVFSDSRIRSNFVKKVYTILAFQLLFTFSFIALCVFEENVKEFMRHNSLILFIVSSLIYMVLAIVIVCFESARRTFPLNFILLIFFTLALSILSATFSCFYSTYSVMVAFGVTTLVCLAISFIACLPCIDITGFWVYLIIGSFIIVIYGFIAIIITIITGSNLAFLIYAWLATILIAFYLLYDTQLILGGKRFELSTEEYILGAISLYTDIITMFMYILCLFGGNR